MPTACFEYQVRFRSVGVRRACDLFFRDCDSGVKKEVVNLLRSVWRDGAAAVPPGGAIKGP